MNSNIQRVEVRDAADDLRCRTLSGMPRALDRMIYLASTRDYNTGMYHHDGLASVFGDEVACEALATCHREAFEQLVCTSLKDLVDQIEAYRISARTSPDEFIAAWKRLEPYRVAVPVETHTVAAEFLFTNFKTALAILEERQKAPLAAERGASPRRSPGR